MSLVASDVAKACDDWGANCGPAAVAAIMGMTLDEVRPYFDAAGFPAKRYTNPTMMFDVLRAIGRPFRKMNSDQRQCVLTPFPHWGLVRVQWEGPWTEPGVPTAARYRHTHWIGTRATRGIPVAIFDVNAVGNGSGWISCNDWARVLVPWLLKEVAPRNYGTWHFTHAIDVECA